MLDKLALNTHERVQHQRRGAATFDQTTQGLKGLAYELNHCHFFITNYMHSFQR